MSNTSSMFEFRYYSAKLNYACDRAVLSWALLHPGNESPYLYIAFSKHTATQPQTKGVYKECVGPHNKRTCFVTLFSIRQSRRRDGRLAKGLRSRMLSSELLANIIVCTFGSDSFRSSPIRNIRLFERSSVFSRFNNGKFCKENKEGKKTRAFVSGRSART